MQKDYVIIKFKNILYYLCLKAIDFHIIIWYNNKYNRLYEYEKG